MESRKILLDSDRPDVRALLRLRDVRGKGEFVRQLNAIYPIYAENCNLHWDFWAAESQTDMDKALRAAEMSKKCSPLVLESIRSHHAFFTSCGRLPPQRDS